MPWPAKLGPMSSRDKSRKELGAYHHTAYPARSMPHEDETRASGRPHCRMLSIDGRMTLARTSARGLGGRRGCPLVGAAVGVCIGALTQLVQHQIYQEEESE